jgi:hypothetical protein
MKMKSLNNLSLMLAAAAIVMMMTGCQSQTTEQAIEPPAEAASSQQESADVSVGKAQAPTAPQEAVALEKGTPKIVLTKAMHDFGDVGPRSTQKADYGFINEGNATLLVDRIQSTCGCSRPTLIKDGKRYDAKAAFDPPIAFEPGESGKVEVTYKAKATKGPVSKKLYILSNDPATARAQLVVKSRTIVNVAVTPEKVDLRFDQPNAGMPELSMKSTDDVPFSIKSISVFNQVITVPFDPEEKATRFVLKPQVDLEKLKQLKAGVIQIATDHPTGGLLQVKYNTRPFYEVSNPRYILSNIEPGTPILRDNLIRSNYGDRVQIESITSQNGYMEVEDQQQDGSDVKLTIKIIPPAQESSTKRHLNDELTIVLKDGQKVPIRCSGWYKSK